MANPARPTSSATPERFLSLARAYRPIPRPDGGLWFASDLAGHAQVYSVDRPLGWPVRVAPSADRTLPVARVNSADLLVRHDLGGNETWQLSLVNPTGTVRRLTSDERAIHHAGRVAPDHRRLGLAYNPNGQVDFVLAVLDLRTGHIEDWLRAEGMWHWSDWRADGEEATVTHALAPTRVESYLLARSGATRRILPGAIRVESPLWAGGRLLALTDHDSEFLRLVEVDPTDPSRARVLFAPQGADVETFVPTHRGDRALVVVNRGAYDELSVVDLAAGRTLQKVDLGAPGIVYSDNVNDPHDQVVWSADDARLLIAWETPRRPSDIHELPPGRPWTATGQSAPAEAATPEEKAIQSFDGETIHCLHFRADERPRPTVVYIHGGPESQFRGNFNPTVQALVAGGLDVLAPNVRGSTGYGRRFFSLDDRELRWDSVRDAVEAGRWLKREHPGLRVAAMGGSYGGFMTLAVLVDDPGLWDAAVDIVGIADWHTFFKNTSGWRRALRAAEYGDPDRPADAEFLAEFSPLRRAHLIKAPLLVIHGRNDVRVPVGEAEQIVAATGAELMIFDDEGHGIVRHGNRVRAYTRAVEFLREKLS